MVSNLRVMSSSLRSQLSVTSLTPIRLYQINSYDTKTESQIFPFSLNC